MDILFKSRHTTVPERFRRHAAAKLARLERLDSKAVRVDVEVSQEHNPRQADFSERVELTIRSRGPAIRAEAAADDRYGAFDLAFAKLEGQLRRAAERRKARRDATVRVPGVLAGAGVGPASRAGASALGSVPDALSIGLTPPDGAAAASNGGSAGTGQASAAGADGDADLDGHPEEAAPLAGLVPIQMEGDGPVVVREKVHASKPMTIDQALLEMELVGHDFYLFHDSDCDKFSVVYRRRGYDYGVIRLAEE